MSKESWLNTQVFVDEFGRDYNLSDVPMTYMTRKVAFEKRGYSQDKIDELKTRIENHRETSDPCTCEAASRHDFTSTYQEDCEPCKQRYKESREFDDMNRQLHRKKGDREALVQEQILLQLLEYYSSLVMIVNQSCQVGLENFLYF